MRRNVAFCWRTLHLARQQSAVFMRLICGHAVLCGMRSYAASCGSCGHAAMRLIRFMRPCGSCGSCDPIFVGFELISLLYL
ncbi:hypothetical protein M6B38_269500 [Iris pallida]|uniref:Secreted protein n=1 Tax=Iris pallida TaxID=29817 RepID=A0AAX6I8A3_IRIPA|nr:hypothetical protein M6B38_269500 [Iris pallida]